MSRAPFQPVGEKPRWELIYAELVTLDVGDTLTYERLYELLEVEDRSAVRTPFYKAAQVWGSEAKRALRPVPNVGYRVVEAAEHEQIAKGQHRSARRKLRKSRQVLANADRSRLDEDQKRRFDQLEATLGRHEDMIRRLDARTAKVEKAVAESKQKHNVTDERISALEDALRRNGIDPNVRAS